MHKMNNRKLPIKLFISIGFFLMFTICLFKYTKLIEYTKIHNIKIVGNDYVNKSMIEDVLEISPSRDLLTFDVEKNQDKINNIDFIRSSRVSKIFPSTVVIEIIENEPIAHVIKNNKDFILDENGNYLPFSERILNYYSIPKLYFKEVTNNLEIVQSSIEKDFGLKLKDIKNSFPQIYNQISKIDYSQFGDLRFVIKQNTEIYMKENKIDLHFKILDEFKQISQNYTNYELIDLRVNGQLIVKESKFKKS